MFLFHLPLCLLQTFLQFFIFLHLLQIKKKKGILTNLIGMQITWLFLKGMNKYQNFLLEFLD